MSRRTTSSSRYIFPQGRELTLDKTSFQGRLCHEIFTCKGGYAELTSLLKRLSPSAKRWDCANPADLEHLDWLEMFSHFGEILTKFVKRCDVLSNESCLWILPGNDEDATNDQLDKKFRKRFKMDMWVEEVNLVTEVLDFMAIVLKHGVNRHKFKHVPILARLLGSTIDFVVDSTLNVVNALVRPIELHRELEEQNVTDTPASYSRDLQMQLFRLVHGWRESDDVDITQIASAKQSKIPVALSGLHFEYFVSNAIETKSGRDELVVKPTSTTSTTTVTTSTTTTKKSKKKKRNSTKTNNNTQVVHTTPPPPARKKRRASSSSSTGLRVLKVSSKQMSKVQCTRNDPSRTGKWFARFVRENKIPKKQWPPLLAIARRCTSFSSKQGRIRAVTRRFDALRALLRSNPQEALIDLYFAHEPELVSQMAKACSPDVSMPSSVQLAVLNTLEALVVWCDTGGGHFTLLARRTGLLSALGIGRNASDRSSRRRRPSSWGMLSMLLRRAFHVISNDNSNATYVNVLVLEHEARKHLSLSFFLSVSHTRKYTYIHTHKQVLG
jgi:hypothetical protein